MSGSMVVERYAGDGADGQVGRQVDEVAGDARGGGLPLGRGEVLPALAELRAQGALAMSGSVRVHTAILGDAILCTAEMRIL